MSGPVEGEGVHLPEPELLLMRPPPVPARLRLLSSTCVHTHLLLPHKSREPQGGHANLPLATALGAAAAGACGRLLCSHEVHLLCPPQGSVSSGRSGRAAPLSLLSSSPEGLGWAAAGAAGGCRLRLHCSREPGPGGCLASAAPPGPARPHHPIVPAPPREVSGGMSRLLPPLPFPLVLWGRGCAA